MRLELGPNLMFFYNFGNPGNHGNPGNPGNSDFKQKNLFMILVILVILSYIINLKLGQASYAITNEICNESFLALENLVTQQPQPTPSSPNFRSFSADLFLKLFQHLKFGEQKCALICFDWNFFKHFAQNS